jgi:hypothetical protein
MAVENIERDEFRRTPRTFFLTIVIIIVGSLICTGVFTMTIDTVCQRNAAEWIPLYPNAEVVAENKTFLNAFGVGVTQTTLYSPDNVNEVREWYMDTRRSNEANPTNLLATMRYSVSEVEEGGSTIFLYSECAWR